MAEVVEGIMKSKIIEFIKFSIVGGVMTLISILLFTMFIEWLSINYLVSNVISYVIAVLLSYYVNSRYTFNQKDVSKKNDLIAATKFFIMKLCLLALDSICLYLLVDIMGANVYVSKILLTILFLVVSYPISKLIMVIKKGEK